MNNLRKIRVNKGLTLRELAGKVNIHYTTISSLENGKTLFNSDYIEKLCRYFEVSADYLLGLNTFEFTDKVQVLNVVKEDRITVGYVANIRPIVNIIPFAFHITREIKIKYYPIKKGLTLIAYELVKEKGLPHFEEMIMLIIDDPRQDLDIGYVKVINDTAYVYSFYKTKHYKIENIFNKKTIRFYSIDKIISGNISHSKKEVFKNV